MGSRKRNTAEAFKDWKKSQYFAVLRNCPTSPRKMRLVTDLIRGKEVNKALNTLRYSNKEAAGRVEKLLLSAIANWQNKNEGVRIDDQYLFVSEISVDSARILKRLRPAPQGRAHRIRKRSNHVTLFIRNMNEDRQMVENQSENVVETANKTEE
jgi:large subunit ribosomal protein L22